MRASYIARPSPLVTSSPSRWTCVDKSVVGASDGAQGTASWAGVASWLRRASSASFNFACSCHKEVSFALPCAAGHDGASISPHRTSKNKNVLPSASAVMHRRCVRRKTRRRLDACCCSTTLCRVGADTTRRHRASRNPAQLGTPLSRQSRLSHNLSTHVQREGLEVTGGATRGAQRRLYSRVHALTSASCTPIFQCLLTPPLGVKNAINVKKSVNC